ncbi:hypothetical protein [Lacticaseibacillus paracasei]|uniref:hypothetical protein n=1 Tax=Lacticaseibacillus paracasei TaxID=1597 RepID=UPI000AE8C56E|nr:hypothetical protein [Lacticaseibacillus paracasei]RNE03614.1 hypothetical protein FAM22278_02835 [Lacticaseibacillus paracasei]
MNVYHALKMIQIEHQPLNHRQVVITDENGKSLSQLTDLLRTCLVSFKNYLQEGQYNHLKTAVKGAFTVFPKSPTFV